uniref:toll-like receptor 13 n=1 Tax=Monopterus albus TaxID=43700 RepID=UPI0009B38B5A|nr:toll-like receptor 13 [Monopterus albus]
MEFSSDFYNRNLKLDPGAKEDKTMQVGKRKLIIFLYLLHFSTFAAPVTGFSLKACRMTSNTVICAKSQLKAVPRDIPSTTKVADLSANKISRIQVADFKNLLLLTQLELNRNYISQIDNGAFANLICLEKLNLNNNKLVELGEDVFHGLSNLTELRIGGNRIQTVAFSSFRSMTSLKFLDISHNKLHEIAKVHSILQHLPHLRELYIKNNNINTFHSWELTNSSLELGYLDLSQNPIAVFQITADIFPHLIWFNIGGSRTKQQMMWDVRNKTFLNQVSTLDISGLQMALGDMKTLLETANSSLRTLRMNAMKHSLTALINISCTIPTMSNLQLRYYKLRSVSSTMFTLCIYVTELDLTQNHIQIIHVNAFRSLPGLRILNLSQNKLSSVPVAIRNLPTLRELNLSANNISRLGCDDFANQTMLRQLSLYNNMISALNECVFKDLIRLQVLKLQTNHINKLNGAFQRHLPNLRQLYLNVNQLTNIKYGEFKGLHSLQNLSLHDNQIETLEKGCFIGLTNLTDMLLQKNLITQKALNNGSFNDLISLRRLDFRDNYIKFENDSLLPNPPFSQLSCLETLAIPSQHGKGTSKLPRNLLQGLTNLIEFSVRDIQLIFLHKDMFIYTPQLQTLDISSNDLMDLSSDLFSPVQNLKSLYISRTSLQSLDFLIGANLTKLEFLQARKNQYSVISEEIIKSVPALVYMDLQGNSFTCDCNNAWFLKWAEDNNQTQVFDAFNFVCNFPLDLKGMKLLDLDIRHIFLFSTSGKPIIDNITDAIYGSRKTICVISRRYLESEWCSREIQVASFRLLDEQKDVLILVFLEEIPTALLSPYYRMKKLLKRKTCLSWPRAIQHTNLFWEKLRQALKTTEDVGGDRFPITLQNRVYQNRNTVLLV